MPQAAPLPTPAQKPSKPRSKDIAIFQGAFYLVSGPWPLFDLGSFEKVTGPKSDKWLVKTVGILIAVSGGVFLKSGLRVNKSRQVPEELQLIARGQAIALGSASLYYSLIGRISKVYLLDAVAEACIAACWGMTGEKHRRRPALGSKTC